MKINIIAEAGVNHNGRVDNAIKLVDKAAIAGADIVKFQTFKADMLTTDKAPKANYQIRNTGNNNSQSEMLKSLEMSDEMHEAIIERCKSKKIEFLSTAFDPQSLNYLLELGIKRIKIPSGEITNFFLLEEAAKANLNVILSTGMAHMNEIEAALNILYKYGANRENITILQCVTDYPAKAIDYNLKTMKTFKECFGTDYGISDHTLGINVSLASAALEASIIEKHFTLNKKMNGPDHSASLDPDELKLMCSSIREISNSLGDGVKRPTNDEINNIIAVRKSLVASREILQGEVFSKDNVTAKRPGDGLSPMKWNELEGKKSSKRYKKDQKIN